MKSSKDVISSAGGKVQAITWAITSFIGDWWSVVSKRSKAHSLLIAVYTNNKISRLQMI